MQSGSVYKWEIMPAGQDLVQVAGDLQIDADWTLQLFIDGVPIDPHTRYLLFEYEGTLDGLVESCTIDTSNVDVSLYSRWDSSDAEVLVDAQRQQVYLYGLVAEMGGPIPEPASCLLLAAGLAVLARRRRRAC